MREENGLSIPRWFVRVTTGAIGLAVPWAAWVTLQLISIGVRVETLSHVNTRFHAHVADPALHRAGLGRVDDALGSLSGRLDRLEAKLDRLAEGQR